MVLLSCVTHSSSKKYETVDRDQSARKCASLFVTCDASVVQQAGSVPPMSLCDCWCQAVLVVWHNACCDCHAQQQAVPV